MSVSCQTRTSAKSFNHLVGAGEQHWGHGEVQVLGGLQVDPKLELGHLENYKLSKKFVMPAVS